MRSHFGMSDVYLDYVRVYPHADAWRLGAATVREWVDYVHDHARRIRRGRQGDVAEAYFAIRRISAAMDANAALISAEVGARMNFPCCSVGGAT
jgi:hypothetical protein